MNSVSCRAGIESCQPFILTGVTMTLKTAKVINETWHYLKLAGALFVLGILVFFAWFNIFIGVVK